MDYFTLRALGHAWDRAFRGATLIDVWTQSPRELSMRLERDGQTTVLRVVCEGALALAFDAPGGGRQKRNTSDVFAGIEGASVGAITVAELDRHLTIGLDRGAIQIPLFGSRPNVLWTTGGGVSPTQPNGATIRHAFLRDDVLAGTPAPQPRPAPDARTADAVAARWTPKGTWAAAARRAIPLLPRELATDAVRAAGLDPEAPADGEPGAPPAALVSELLRVRDAVEAPTACVVWRGERGEALLPAPPAVLDDGLHVEDFDDVRKAARVYARRALGQRAFDVVYRPLEKALAASHSRRARSADAMLDELAQPSRADGYEHSAHLLMASAAGQPAGRESVELPDLMGDGSPVEIALDPALTAIENAERYYDRARRARRSRAEAEGRWEGAAAEADALDVALVELRALRRPDEVEAFRETHAGLIGELSAQARGEVSEPFHRFALPGGFQAMVGKHARGNAHLTTKVATAHDLWLHARGVPGSHVVIRRGSRDAQIPEPTVIAAARLAAYFSEARRQPLAPVQVTERKYVRPIKGGPPGLVRVDRERVVDVVPGKPD